MTAPFRILGGWQRATPNAPETNLETARAHVSGAPDLAAVGRSDVERQNLTMRTRMRRLIRLTNAFRRKVEDLSKVDEIVAVLG
ncbi:MAG TPA: hypothetical protein VMU65_06015 [Candidatus Saccharimonadales bacterium]|nr:hypothetical protein [Candidatus Saccharimonadales bacterium]